MPQEGSLGPDVIIPEQTFEARGAGTAWITARAAELNQRWRPVAFVIDRRAAAGSLVTDMERAGLPVQAAGAQDMAHACGQLYDAFRDDLIRHYGQTSLEKAIAGADKRPLSEAWAWDRRNTAADITPLVSATLAVWGYMKFSAGADYDARYSVHFDLDEITRLVRAGYYGPADLSRLAAEGLISQDDIPAVIKAARESADG